LLLLLLAVGVAMGTISDFLGRKGVPSASAVPVPASPKQPGSTATAEQNGPTFADLGARIGEGNESLRNLLIDTERRITALDDVKCAFGDLVEPIGIALHALEQEKTDNAGLRNVLAELRASHEALRSECHAFEKRAAEFEGDTQTLRRELALAQQAARALESDKAELTSELVTARSAVANLESQLAQETANARSLGEANQILVDHSDSADKRIVELQADGALTREKLSLLETDKHSLQTALDQTLAESSRLSRRLTESESALAAARARLEQMEIALASADNERAALCAARDEAGERHQSESYGLNLQLEAMRSRAATAEKLLSEVRQNLIARTEEIRSSERRAVEATIARNATERTVERLTAARDALDAKVKELEQARATLLERSNGHAETAKARETSLAHAEQKIKSLTDRVDQLEHDGRAYRSRTVKRIEELNETLQRERVELAVARGALETTRRDYARLQRGLTAERTAQQSGSDVDERSDPPTEPSKSKNGRSDGRGAKTMEAKPEDPAVEPTSAQ
jgi:chromosome segregation ATPase